MQSAVRGRHACKEENHFLFGCKSEEDRHIDHMLTGAEEDPRKIAMSRMLDSLLTHTETMTATETMEQEYKDRYDLKRLLREHDYAAGLIARPPPARHARQDA